MKHIGKVAITLGLAAGAAQAGGLDRTYTPTDILWEKGNHAELSFGYVSPDLSGRDVLGNSISNVADDFSLVGGAVKVDFGGKYSFAMIYDQPYGSDVEYGGSPATTMLGGTSADAETHSITALLKYQATERISVYGGPRFLRADGEVTLSGLAYGPLSGYNVQFKKSSGVGYVAGAAYEIPDIAFRASLTYHSSIDVDFATLENLPAAVGGPGFAIPTGDTNSKTPQVVNLELQSGIAKDTLLFGGVRWSEWSEFTLIPPVLDRNISQFKDIYTFKIGVGRKFSDKFSANVSISYEDGGGDDLVSPLTPYNGLTSLQLGGKYQISETVALSGAIRYTMLGDSNPETGTPDAARASFKNNDALSAGLKIGISF